MKRVRFALITAAVVFLAVPAQRTEAATCSNATLYNVGTYGWASQSIYPPGIDVGYVTFLSSGSLLGSIYGGTDGSHSTSSLSGTYTVNSTCTMTISMSNGDSLEGIVVSSGQEVLLDQTSPTGYNYLVDLKAVVATSCSDSTLYSIGTYGFAELEVYSSQGAWVGYITFTSSGTWAGYIWGGYNGSETSGDISGTYSVNSNCTLTFNFTGGSDNQGVIVSNGAEIFLVATSIADENELLDLKKE